MVSLKVNLPAQINDRFDPYAIYASPSGKPNNRDDELEAWRDNAEARAASDDELSSHLHELVSE